MTTPELLGENTARLYNRTLFCLSGFYTAASHNLTPRLLTALGRELERLAAEAYLLAELAERLRKDDSPE